jgi:hypothetical protein
LKRSVEKVDNHPQDYDYDSDPTVRALSLNSPMK